MLQSNLSYIQVHACAVSLREGGIIFGALCFVLEKIAKFTLFINLLFPRINCIQF